MMLKDHEEVFECTGLLAESVAKLFSAAKLVRFSVCFLHPQNVFCILHGYTVTEDCQIQVLFLLATQHPQHCNRHHRYHHHQAAVMYHC